MTSGFFKVEFDIVLQKLHQEALIKTTKGLGVSLANFSASSNVYIFNWAKLERIAQKKIISM